MSILNSQTLTEKAVASASLVLGGRGAVIVLRIINLAILARILTPDEFGLATASMLVVGLFSMISGLGMGPALTQRLKIGSSDIQAVFYLMLASGVLLSVILFSFRGVLAGLLSAPQVENQLKVLCLSFLVAPFSKISQALLQRSLQFKKIAIGNLISYFIGNFSVSLILAYMGFGVWSIILAILGEQIISGVVFYLFSSFSLRPPSSSSSVVEYLKFGTGVTLSQVANHIALQADNFITLRYLGVGDLGLYSRAYQLIASPAVLLGGTVSSIVFPMLSKVQEDRDKLRDGYIRSIIINGVLTLPVSVILLILAPNIVEVILGGGWSDAVKPLAIMAAGLLFRSGYKVGQSVMQAKGAVTALALQEIVYAIAVILGSLVGQQWGIVGVSYGVLGAITLNYIFVSVLAMKLTSLRWFEFIAAHNIGLKICLIIGPCTWLIKTGCNLFQAPIELPLIIIAILCTIGISVLFVWFPWAIGEDIHLAFSMIKKRLKK